KANAARFGSPWTWTLAFLHHKGGTPTHGYAFAKSWRRESARAAIGEPLARSIALGAARTAGGSEKRAKRLPTVFPEAIPGKIGVGKKSDFIGAGEGNRTLDIQLGKLSFYH